MKRVIAALSILLVILFMACDINAADLTVSAAISLKNAFEEIGKKYEAAHPGTKVLFNFGASGDLVRQIEGGAPVDVFASAAQKDIDEMAAKGLILAGTRTDFAKNRVVLVTPKTGNIKSFEDLTSSGVKRIAAGNPKTVPAGRYAAEVFDYYKITPSIKDKLVYAENVRQVLDYVARGEVDAGVVYSTDAAVRSAEVNMAAEAPEASHKPVIYPIAVVKGTKNETDAKAFAEAVRSKEGTAILTKYGFRIP
ncbi:MAG TPA: molybdate ABC transporter substrate-binding protein [Dissulfurispiraceae bacterium]|nr:molybdate ABC transporter substrate-binding protein [Dissulfurispiraceae bacterium]